MTTKRIDSTDGKITVFYRMTPWAWAIAMALASVYIREPYEDIVAYVEDNLNTPVITADDNDD